ncbi:hypothetical protein [Cupriavidus sp. IK-TO18]|uniref:hypothetical protein n=1 Tax=Cupriavidus sp. IK-TO18 TaxID=2782182 RepID=UPI00189B3F6A|nr:hypothetical protein [Cupriavidus sp. IK-TO18]MBF6990779.1 hypothetical protein [Cupriavidus sp. IK-TO18]
MFGISQEVWFPVLTLILGALLKGAGDWATDSRKDKREAGARNAERRIKRNELQRATLLELQEMAARLGRFAGRAHHEDAMAVRRGGTWGKSLLGNEVSEGLRSASADVIKLSVRVRDGDIRELASRFVGQCAAASMAKSESESERKLNEAIDTDNVLNERIGKVLRALDDDET